MIKSNSAVYLFPLHSIYDKESAPAFHSFSNDNSELLYSCLFENYNEILQTLSDKTNLIYVLDERDKLLIPEQLLVTGAEYYFGNTCDKSLLLKGLADKYFRKYHNNLVIFFNSIGVTASDIVKAFDLLSIEDESFVIGKSSSGGIAFIGFNSYNMELFESINWQQFEYENFLLFSARHEHFMHILNNFQVVRDIPDFKKLYEELSKKESLVYCSQSMHERFTNLFIEYKDLLK